ncbi:hypothetical protein ILUMI_21682 [Ignelater luminosus]|uniref:Uncharacterized protein n=1 Tax=Ignelater luminosus TaxID=2038154 RepID=A0A8K0CFZ0_IGNLU|nr:hypothetical protein ILUMI_21682 [Ignelater luminosus]
MSRSSVSKTQIRKWFLEISDYLCNILKDRKCIFKAEASAFFLSPNRNKVLAPKGCVLRMLPKPIPNEAEKEDEKSPELKV